MTSRKVSVARALRDGSFMRSDEALWFERGRAWRVRKIETVPDGLDAVLHIETRSALITTETVVSLDDNLHLITHGTAQEAA